MTQEEAATHSLANAIDHIHRARRHLTCIAGMTEHRLRAERLHAKAAALDNELLDLREWMATARGTRDT